MADRSLVERDISYGEQVVRALDASEDAAMHPIAALWFLFPEDDTWRLLLALPARAEQEPQLVYQKLIDVLVQAGVRGDLESIGLMAPDNPLIRLLAVAIQTPENAVSGIRFTDNVVNGQLVPDAYIYRLSIPSTAEARASTG